MVGYDDYANLYKLFDPSSQKKFIERSVHFEEEPMLEIELDKGECSHSPLHDDVSDDSSSNFSDFYIEDDFYNMHIDHDSPIMPNQANKTIQATSDLVGDPLDSRKTISQFHNAFSTCELNILERCYMMVGFYPQTYK